MKKFVFLLALILNLSNGLGQKLLPELYFENEVVSVEQGQTFANFLIIKNLTEDTATIKNLLPLENYPGILLTPESNYLIAPGETKRLPVKFLATLEFLKRKNKEVGFSLQFSHNGKAEKLSASFSVSGKEEKTIAVFTGTSLHYFDPKLPESTISLIIENQEYNQRSLKVTFKSIPDGLDIRTAELPVQLDARERKMIEFKFSLRRQQNSYPDYRIEINIEDIILNKNVGSTVLQVVALTNNRKIASNYESFGQHNSVELAYNQMDNRVHNLQIKGNTDFYAGNQINGRFNSTADYYFDQNAVSLLDTWVEFEKNSSVLKLGNLYGEDYDYSVFGRGAKGRWQMDEHRALEVLAIDNNYNLYSNFYKEMEGAKMVGAKYDFKKGDLFQSKISYLFDHNPRLATNTNLIHAVSPFLLDSIHQFRLEAGMSAEKGLVNADEQLGGHMGLNYQSQIRNWDLHSTNSLSSSNYAGQTRGSYLLNQLVGYQLKKRKRLFLQYEYSKVKPEYLSFQHANDYPSFPLHPGVYDYRQQKLQTGYQYGFRTSNIILSPQILEQSNLENGLMNSFLSYRLRSDFGTSLNSHGVNVSVEYSYSIINKSDWFSGVKTNFSYRYKGFHVNAFYQYNPGDVTDLRQRNHDIENFMNYSLNTSYSFSGVRNNLRGSVTAGMNYSELYQNTNKHMNGNVEYKFNQSWAVTAFGAYNRYQTSGLYNFEGGNVQLRIGVKKYFERPTVRGNHKVNLQFFNDKNGNGVWDEHEEVLASEQVQLNGNLAVTDKKGRVTFQNVPKGHYELKAGKTELELKGNKDLLVDRNLNLKIGLKKFNKVNGKLKELKQAYDAENSDVTGIVIYAKDADGSVVSTVVNQNSEFEFFLKDGTYDLFIENNTYEYTTPSLRIKVADGNYGEEIVFEYKKKNKEIKIKRF